MKPLIDDSRESRSLLQFHIRVDAAMPDPPRPNRFALEDDIIPPVLGQTQTVLALPDTLQDEHCRGEHDAGAHDEVDEDDLSGGEDHLLDGRVGADSLALPEGQQLFKRAISVCKGFYIICRVCVSPETVCNTNSGLPQWRPSSVTSIALVRVTIQVLTRPNVA